MEKNIITLFSQKVVEELKAALAERRKEKPDETSAMLKFNVAEVFRTLGAGNVTLSIAINKDYTWLRTSASKDGFYYPLDFSQRCQAKKAELDSMKEIVGKPLDEAICVAGIYQTEEEERFSMKWDELKFHDEDGIEFGIRYTGPVRKWNAEAQEYDGPVAAE